MNFLLDAESKSAVWQQSGTLVVLNYAAVSLAILLSIWEVGALQHDPKN